MRARLGDSVSGRYRPEENLLLTKHVVAAGRFVKDAGSTPAASTIEPHAIARDFGFVATLFLPQIGKIVRILYSLGYTKA